MKKLTILLTLLAPLMACIIAALAADHADLGWHALPYNAARELIGMMQGPRTTSQVRVVATILALAGCGLLTGYVLSSMMAYRKRSIAWALTTMVTGMFLIWGWSLFVVIPLCVIPQT